MSRPVPVLARGSNGFHTDALADLRRGSDPWLLRNRLSLHTGTLRLFAAVLEGAMDDLLDRSDRTYAETAAAWIFGAGAPALLPFSTVCEALDVDAAWLRGRLRPFAVVALARHRDTGNEGPRGSGTTPAEGHSRRRRRSERAESSAARPLSSAGRARTP